VAAPQIAGLPPFFTLDNGMVVRVTAQNPLTGATVAGVVVSNVSLAVDQEEVTSPPDTQKPGEIFLMPGPAMVTT
jgi:hypothetical protein